MKQHYDKLNRLQLEKHVQKQIVEALSWKGWLVMHIPNQATQGRQRWAGLCPGAPDLLAVKAGGRVVFIEVKSPTTPISPHQQQLHELLRGWGFEVIVARDLDDIKHLLDE